MSKIEWTETTWNPVTGCSKVSPGCKFCYAETMHKRLYSMGLEKYNEPFSAVRCHPDALNIPFSWKKSRTVFVNSMSDLFHEEVPLAFIQQVFATMADCSQHTFQILTKRHERLRELAPDLDWPPNVWMGVSVENKTFTHRIEYLRAVPAHVRFLSIEPLIGSVGMLNLQGIYWVIVGGESGPKARPMQADWVRDIRHQCELVGVPFFFKQWGGRNKKANGRMLDGQTYDEMPITNP
jgi:protein gp37